VLLLVFRHVIPVQGDAHRQGKLAGQLRLSDPGRPGEEQGCHRLALVLKTGARAADGLNDRVDCPVLPEDLRFQLPIEALQTGHFRRGYGLFGNPGDLGHDPLDFAGGDHLRSLVVFPEEPRPRSGLVQHVDRLVGKVAVVDVLRRQVGDGVQGLVGVGDVMKGFVPFFQPAEDLVGLVHRRLGNFDGLKAPREGAILVEVFPELFIGRRADAAHSAGGERGFQDVGCVHGSAGYGPGPDDRVNLVDEEDHVLDFLEVGNDFFQPLLEVAAEAGTGQQGPHVQRVDFRVFQGLGNGSPRDPLGQALRDGRFAHARLADVNGIVLVAAAENLNRPLDDVLPADEGVHLALAGFLHQFRREGVQDLARLFRRAFLRVGLAGCLACGLIGDDGYAVGDVVQKVQTGDALAVEEKSRMGFLLVVNGDQ